MALIGNSLVQSFLKDEGFYTGRIDGDFRTKSWSAVERFLKSVDKYNPNWNNYRLRLAVEQIMMAIPGFYQGPIDGLEGPKTRKALQLFRNASRDATAPAASGSTLWPVYRTSDLIQFFGHPGKNQTRCEMPYTMELAWDPSKKVNRFSCNVKVKEPFERIFHRTLDYYGLDQIHEMGLHKFGGCLNVRKIRGGRSWSTHAFGAAIDLDPGRNRLRWGRDRANMAQPRFDKFWEFVEDEGMVSLGRERNFDWMHFQAVRLG